jgi:CRISPR-associated endonuclease Cas3-HD
MKVLAKHTEHTKVSLKQHSEDVCKVALHISKICKNKRTHGYANIDKYIKRVSLLHDIGKADPQFQKYIRLSDEDKEKYNKKNKGKFKYYHQETGWAFLTNKTDLTDIELSVIYWHHGVSFPYRKFNIGKRESVCEILANVNTSQMEDYYSSIYPETEFSDGDEHENTQIPLFYNRELAPEKKRTINYIRMCVYSADRIVSKLEETNTVADYEEHIKKIITSSTFTLDSYPGGNKKRFEEQQTIVDNCDDNTLIKAPAGFGKTLIGLLWASKSNKKTIWVCPRNAVATSVYGDILKELKITKNTNVSVELYLTGEKKESWNGATNGSFNSDIIVTNIDNFIRPNADLSDADKLFMINNSDVVFDEFHELLTEAALFAAFDIIGNTRIQKTNSRTLFLSATPSLIINTIFPRSVKTLPSKDKHYEPVHTNVYDLNVYDNDESIPYSDHNKSNLFISNAIRTAQDKHKSQSYIYHSKFLKDKKEKIFKNILKDYSKNRQRKTDRKNVFGTHIIQASLDISFNNLYESVLSPEATLQRIGRCDRWGDYKKNSTSINIFNGANSMSEAGAVKTLYNENLKNKWFDYIKPFNGSKVTLKEIYTHYNNFNDINKNEISAYIKSKTIESNKCLAQIYPIGYKIGKGESDVTSADGNKYRSVGNNIYFLLENFKTNEWEGLFSEQIYSTDKFDKQFKETGNILKRIKNIQQKLNNSGKFAFYDKKHKTAVYQHKHRTLDDIRRLSKYSDKPYIRFDVYYDEEKGIMKGN